MIAPSFAFGLARSLVAGGSAFILAVLGLAADAADSIYTSIRRADCAPPPSELRSEFEAKDLGVQECPAPADWHLLFVATDENSWLELRHDDFRWSAENAIVYQRPIGLFPNVGGSSVVEWRRDDRGRPNALIFRVVAQDPTDPADQVSRLFVVRVGEDKSCVIGRVTTNEAARTLADGPGACSGPS